MRTKEAGTQEAVAITWAGGTVDTYKHLTGEQFDVTEPEPRSI